tara:strand:+ start:67 stop:207 length:141 start_codon:yes stop_codon:yes gene_type:complete
MICGEFMVDNLLWWFWLIVVIVCVLIMPGLWQMFLESIEENERNKK